MAVSVSLGVGTPFHVPGVFVVGGQAPITWALSPGSSLPPGISLVAGSNGVPPHIAGIPTTLGDYTFSFVVTDGAGQTLTLPEDITIAPLALADSVPNGKVGTAYSASLTPSGGTGPYTVTLDQGGSDSLPGLTLSHRWSACCRGRRPTRACSRSPSMCPTA
jgi:hypothetical protein